MTDPIAIIGGGPAGMAAALAFITTGREVRVYERYREARPAGVILNLWPPPIRALEEMGVDIEDLGAPCRSTFRNAAGHIRAEVKLPQEIIDRYQGGFIGMLRPDLYRRMLDALPENTIQFGKTVTSIDDRGDHVHIEFDDGTTTRASLVVGADGIDSVVRKSLWGDSEKRAHNLQVLGGYVIGDIPSAEANECVVAHGSEVQGSYSSIRTNGQSGFQWWTTEPWADDADGPEDYKAHALGLAAEFGQTLTDLITATAPENTQRWMIRDRASISQWSKGRVTLTGDAAHPTSPYAAYGAGMAISDGYFLAKILRETDLADTAAVGKALTEYDEVRLPHTTSQVEQAYALGQQFHHTPVEDCAERDHILDETPFLQEMVGDKSPAEIAGQLDVMGTDRL